MAQFFKITMKYNNRDSIKELYSFQVLKNVFAFRKLH